MPPPTRVRQLDIKKGDTVYVLRGADRQTRLGGEEAEKLSADRRKAEAEKHAGARGRVLRVFPSTRRVLVEGLHMATKHARPRGRQAAGLRPHPPEADAASRPSPASSRFRQTATRERTSARPARAA